MNVFLLYAVRLTQKPAAYGIWVKEVVKYVHRKGYAAGMRPETYEGIKMAPNVEPISTIACIWGCVSLIKINPSGVVACPSTRGCSSRASRWCC